MCDISVGHVITMWYSRQCVHQGELYLIKHILYHQKGVKDYLKGTSRQHDGKGLVTDYGQGGGLQNGKEWGHMNFQPYEKGGGAEKVLAMLEGGHNKFWGSV